MWLATLAILAGQLIAAAWILDAVAGVPKPVGCLIAGGVMTLYFTAGGLTTSAWVNLVQLVVLLVGLLLTLPIALAGVGGWQGIAQAADTARLLRLRVRGRVGVDLSVPARAGVHRLAGPPAEGVRRA